MLGLGRRREYTADRTETERLELLRRRGRLRSRPSNTDQKALPRLLAPWASYIVGHGEPKQQQQEEQRRDHDQLGELFAGVPDVHEEESDQSGLDGGDGESDGGVKGA